MNIYRKKKERKKGREVEGREKRGKEENHKPISLVYIDAKVLNKIIAHEMKQYMLYDRVFLRNAKLIFY